MGRDAITERQSRGADLKVVGSQGNAFGSQMCPDSRMDARNHEIEGHDRNCRKEFLDEGLAARPL